MAPTATNIVLRLLLALSLLGLAGCGVVDVKKTERLPPEKVLPLRTATLQDLLRQLTEQRDSIRSINAVAELVPSTGSAYSGVIEEYHDVRAFILAVRVPAEGAGTDAASGYSSRQVRMIGQAPVVRKNIFDMVADEARFRVLIPSKNKFIVGPNEVIHRSQNPIENLRPQHLFDALFLEAPYGDTPLFLEENEFGGRRFYALSEVVLNETGQFLLNRKWWFERSQLQLVRVQHFDEAGRLVADVHYSDWLAANTVLYPTQIELARPQEDYRLKLLIKELTLNEPIAAEKFILEQPEGTELLDLAKQPPPEAQP